MCQAMSKVGVDRLVTLDDLVDAPRGTADIFG
jgi:hypothetical protein